MQWWVENAKADVELCKRLGLYGQMVALSHVKVAREVVKTLKTVPCLQGVLGQFTDADLVRMVRACRDDAGIEPLGPVAFIPH